MEKLIQLLANFTPNQVTCSSPTNSSDLALPWMLPLPPPSPCFAHFKAHSAATLRDLANKEIVARHAKRLHTSDTVCNRSHMRLLSSQPAGGGCNLAWPADLISLSSRSAMSAAATMTSTSTRMRMKNHLASSRSVPVRRSHGFT